MHEYISSGLRFFYVLVVNFPLEELLYYYSSFNIFMKTFPEDIQCIVQPINGRGGIYISNVEAAENPSTLKKHGIEAVITAIKGRNLDKVIPQHIQYMYVPAVDHESFDISYYFEDANNFIDEERKRTNVLVHCMAGISRSVSLVIAYLIKHHDKTFNQAFNFVKSRRQIIHPNSSFISQLRAYESNINKKEVTAKKEFSRIQKNIKSNSVMKKSMIENPKFEINYDLALKQNIRMVFKQKPKKDDKIQDLSRSTAMRNTVSSIMR